MNKLRAFCAALLVALFPASVHAGNSSTSFTPVVQNAAYASGNSLGGLLSISFFRFNTTYDGVLDAVLLASQGGSTVPLTLYIFDRLPAATTCTDKAAFSLGAADVDKLAVAPFSLTPAVSQGSTVSFAQFVQTISMRNKDDQPSAFIYVCLVAGGAVTPATVSDIVLKFFGAF